MALFNKKKLSLDEILNAIADLSEEEKAQIKAKMDEKPEVEEEPKGEEIASETQENDVETPEEMPMEQGEETEGEENIEEPTDGMETPVEQPTEQPIPEVPDANVEDNQADVIQGLTGRITALEEQLAQFSELKELMENFTKKQADSFGYKGAIPGAKKDIHDMSASELKEKMLNGEI